MIASESTNKMDIMDKIVVMEITITVETIITVAIQITMEDIQIMVGIPTIMEGTITIMADTQIAMEATRIMEAIQVMATGATQAMVMEDIQTTIKITGTLETVSEL